MKTIKANQIATIKAEDVRPGHVMPEGLVLGVHEQVGEHSTIVFFECPHASPWAQRGEDVQVFCALSPEATEAYAEVFEQARMYRADQT